MNNRSVQENIEEGSQDYEIAWDASREPWIGQRGTVQLVGAECADCRLVVFPYTLLCPACRAETTRPAALPRTGRLYAFTTVHVAPPGLTTPYTIGYVDLDNGVRVFSQLRGDDLRVDGDVEVDLDVVRIDDGHEIIGHVFRPRVAA